MCQMVAQTRGVVRGAVVLPAAVAVPASPSICSNTVIHSCIQTKERNCEPGLTVFIVVPVNALNGAVALQQRENVFSRRFSHGQRLQLVLERPAAPTVLGVRW